MKQLKFYQISFLFFFLVLFSNNAFSQINDFSSFSKNGIAYSNAGTKLNFIAVEQNINTFIFTTTNKTKVEIEKSKIDQIDLQHGTYSGRFAIGGAAIFLGSSSALLLWDGYNSEQPSLFESPKILVLFLGTTTLAGGIIGALIGLTNKRYKTIYSVPTFGDNKSFLQLKTTAPNMIPSLTLSFSF